MILFLRPRAPNPPLCPPPAHPTTSKHRHTHTHTKLTPPPLAPLACPHRDISFRLRIDAKVHSRCEHVRVCSLARAEGFCEPGSACLVVMLKCRPPRPRSHPHPGRRLTLAGPDREPAWRGTHGARRQPTEPAHSVCAGVATPGQTQLVRTRTCAQAPTRPPPLPLHPTRASRCLYAQFLGLTGLLGVFISMHVFIPSKYPSLSPFSLFFSYSYPPGDMVASRESQESLQEIALVPELANCQLGLCGAGASVTRCAKRDPKCYIAVQPLSFAEELQQSA